MKKKENNKAKKKQNKPLSPSSSTEDISKVVFSCGRQYIPIAVLGKGTYGKVYKVQRTDTKEIFAIKKIKMDVDTEGIPSTALREIAILKKIHHPNIINIADLSFSEKHIELALEYCKFDLKKLMDHLIKKDDPSYNINFIKVIMFQIIKATDFLHSHKILHRDLKPQNILVKEGNFLVKLADFGLSRVYSIPIRPYTREVLTLWYRAPEMMLGMCNYSTGLDIWSIGCMFGELFLKKPLFIGDSEIDQLFKIMQVFGTFNEDILPGYKSFPFYNQDFPFWKPKGLRNYVMEHAQVLFDENALDLLEKMLVIDPIKRISCREMISHPFFEGVKCPVDYDKIDNML
jgi:serine/threonine protein kinase